MAERIQRKRTKGWRMPENTVYVGRGSCWGNPFVVGRDGSAAECVQKYRHKMVPYRNHGCSIEDYFISEAMIDAIKSQLKGKNLACWCKIGEPCHADWLLSIANED